MAISETVLILAGGTAVLSILFGMRLAMRAVAGGAAAPRSDGGQAAGRSGAPDVAGVIALPPFDLSRLPGGGSGARGDRAAPGPRRAFARPLCGGRRARGGRLRHDRHGHAPLCGRRHQHSADPADDGAGGRRHLWANPEPALPGNNPRLPGRRGGKPVGDRAAGAAAVGDQCRRR
jgi:hypothetical protein